MGVRTCVFANNRGGLGKSTGVYQFAAAAAADAAEGARVLVCDLSVHGDVSTLLLGGTQEPTADCGARTRGGQGLLGVPAERTAAGVLQALLEGHRASNTLAGRFAGMMRSGSGGVSVADAAVRVADHTEAAVPESLYLLAGGAPLAAAVAEEDWTLAAQLLRLALEAMEGDWLVIFDTDAELAERVCSRIALACAEKMVLLLSASWNDYCRTLDDPINGLFGVLTKLESTGVPFPRIECCLFNHVKQKERTPVKLHPGNGLARDAMLPFSPVKGVHSQMAQIVDHLYECGWINVERDWKRFYVGGEESSDEGAFSDRYVTALLELPDSVNHASQLTGTPIAMMESKAVYCQGTPGEFKVGKDTLTKCQEDVRLIASRLG